MTRAEGVYIYTSEGEKILDGMSGLWCVALGYGRKELTEAAHRQMLELPYYNSFFQSSNTPAIELARILTEVTPPQFNHVFYTGSGSEANDTLIRLVRRYWQLLGKPERNVIISRWNGYHGSTIAGASLGGMKPMHEQLGPAGELPGIAHINQPYWFGEGGELTPAEFGLARARELEQKILEIGPERVAAFVGEPVQGAGGLVIPPETYWPEIQRIIDKYGILFASDEVICGFGRTGQWFGCEHYGTRPDFLTMAKALSSGYLPIGGLMVGARVAEVLIDKGGEFFHGFTYSGHPGRLRRGDRQPGGLPPRTHRRAGQARGGALSSQGLARAGGPSAGRRGALRGPAGGDRTGAGQEFQAVFRAARRGWHPDARYLHAQWPRHARDARYAVHRAAFGHFALRNRRTTVQSSAVT